MTVLRIRVPKWRDFNPRKDVKKPSWFRLAHDLFENEDFYDFSHGEILAWIYILCACSKKNHDTVTVSLDRVKTVGRISEKVFRSAVKKLEECGSVVVCGTDALRGSDADDTDTYATNVRTNERDGGDGTNEHARGAAPPADSIPEDREAAEARSWARNADLEEILEHYRKRFTEFHKSPPIIFPEDEVALGELYDLPQLDSARLKRVIGSYVRMEDPYFSRNGWNIRTLREDIQKISPRVPA